MFHSCGYIWWRLIKRIITLTVYILVWKRSTIMHIISIYYHTMTESNESSHCLSKLAFISFTNLSLGQAYPYGPDWLIKDIMRHIWHCHRRLGDKGLWKLLCNSMATVIKENKESKVMSLLVTLSTVLF